MYLRVFKLAKIVVLVLVCLRLDHHPTTTTTTSTTRREHRFAGDVSDNDDDGREPAKSVDSSLRLTLR